MNNNHSEKKDKRYLTEGYDPNQRGYTPNQGNIDTTKPPQGGSGVVLSNPTGSQNQTKEKKSS